MRIEPFGVERWMDAHETAAALNCAETCVDSVTIQELLALAGMGPEEAARELAAALLPLKLTYGDISGSLKLRQAIAALYPGRGERARVPGRVGSGCRAQGCGAA